MECTLVAELLALWEALECVGLGSDYWVCGD